MNSLYAYMYVMLAISTKHCSCSSYFSFLTNFNVLVKDVIRIEFDGWFSKYVKPILYLYLILWDLGLLRSVVVLDTHVHSHANKHSSLYFYPIEERKKQKHMKQEKKEMYLVVRLCANYAQNSIIHLICIS